MYFGVLANFDMDERVRMTAKIIISHLVIISMEHVRTCIQHVDSVRQAFKVYACSRFVLQWETCEYVEDVSA